MTLTAEPILLPYLLVLFSPTQYRDEQGRIYVDRLWAADLRQHARYLHNLTVCSYSAPMPVHGGELVRVDDDPAFSTVRLVGMRRPGGLLDAILHVPQTAWRIWREARRCAIVHSSVAAWPLPEAWFVTPIALRLRRPHVIVVESAFWRPSAQAARDRPWRRWWSSLQERAARWCLDRADLTIFTHDGYRQTLLSRPDRGHVIQASWLAAEWILSDDDFNDRVAGKLGRPGLSVAYFGRLVAAKGLLDLVAACLQAERAGLDVRLDIYGEGPLRDEVAQLAQGSPGHRIRLRGIVRYGSELMDRLSTYDAVVVPTRSDEQPRIVYDSFAQGVPVIATDTAGNRECVERNVTGWLVAAGDVEQLTAALQRIGVDKPGWLALGRACLAAARAQTHEAMHERRRILLSPLVMSAQSVN